MSNLDRDFIQELSRKLAEQGKLIEAGWYGYLLGVLPPDAPDIQVKETQKAFMAGAAHLFFSMMSIMDPGGTEPTDADLQKMKMIHQEMHAFQEQLKAEVKRGKSL